MGEGVHLASSPLGSLLGDGVVMADSWISKPVTMEESADDEDSLLDPLLHGHWDCDGCPPPFFDLPPPPRPPGIGVEPSLPPGCDHGDSGGGGGGTVSSYSPYESCDLLPSVNLVDEGGGGVLNNAFVLSAIAAIAVLVVIVLALCILYRKRVSLFRPFKKRNSADCSAADADANAEFRLPSPLRPTPANPLQLTTAAACEAKNNYGNNSIELTENPSSTSSSSDKHVYSNPNYPTLEIGGLPFYLLPATGRGLQGISTPSDHCDTSQNNPGNDYAPGSSIGPIYEDIDRMCTYRGSPPVAANNLPHKLFHPVNRVRGSTSSRPHRGLHDEPRIYYNVFPGESPLHQSSASAGASPLHHHNSGSTTTSSSEVSFGGSSNNSPRHPQQQQQQQQHQRLQAAAMATSPRPRGFIGPSAASPPPAPPPSSTGNSVYYYSDTLRPNCRQNRGFDSDSGISNNQETPPPQLPSSRLHSLAATAAAAAASSEENSPRRIPLRASTGSGSRHKRGKTSAVARV